MIPLENITTIRSIVSHGDKKVQIDIDLQTAFTVVTVIGGAFISMYQRHVTSQIAAANARMDKTEAAAMKRWEKMGKDVEDIEEQLQHTRENYVTNDRFEVRMNDLSKQFEQRTVDLSRQIDKILTRMDSFIVPSRSHIKTLDILHDDH